MYTTAADRSEYGNIDDLLSSLDYDDLYTYNIGLSITNFNI